jgi:phenylacetic acid degradation operon negative regulatory protein
MLDPILNRLRAHPSRTGSLIITFYGDTIAPRGGSLWLGTLQAVFRGIGIGDGVVRTAVSRLAADRWLARRRIGRNSFYRLDRRGLAATEAAASKIYGPLTPPWSGHFRLAILDGPAGPAAPREGFGSIGPNLLVSADERATAEGLLLTAQADIATARALAARAWPLADLAERYRAFIAACPAVPDTVPAEDALLARVLLVHEYRRVVLRDPHLPGALLPADWPGYEARSRCAAAYAVLQPVSERWLDLHALNEAGPLPPPDPPRRFA